MKQPVCVDLFCGRGGWTDGFLAHGWDVIGTDVKRYREYAGRFMLHDVGTLDGTLFRGIDLVVASPPCTAFSRHDQPGLFPNEPPPDMALVNASFQFARAAGVPLVLENVRGLQKFLGQAINHYGSFYLWGDGVPCLMPKIIGRAGRPRLKWKHRSASMRSRIPFELASWVAQCHTNRLALEAAGGSAAVMIKGTGDRVSLEMPGMDSNRVTSPCAHPSESEECAALTEAGSV